jgi:hypothetical protein
MALSSYDKHRFRLGWLVVMVVILGVLASGAIALSTADRCGEYRNAKDWHFLPPHWECR